VDSRKDIGVPVRCPKCGGNTIILQANTGKMQEDGDLFVYLEWMCEQCGYRHTKRI
jgi:C4-type Zn-finger protein